MEEKRAGQTRVVAVSVTDEFWQLAKDNGISWAEAMRVGLAVILSDITPRFNNPLNKSRKDMIRNENIGKSLLGDVDKVILALKSSQDSLEQLKKHFKRDDEDEKKI